MTEFFTDHLTNPTSATYSSAPEPLDLSYAQYTSQIDALITVAQTARRRLNVAEEMIRWRMDQVKNLIQKKQPMGFMEISDDPLRTRETLIGRHV